MGFTASLTGTVRDISNTVVPNGRITIVLWNYGDNTPTVNGSIIVEQILKVTANGSGVFNATVYGNDVISPANTYYTVSFGDATGENIATSSYMFNADGSYDLGVFPPNVIFPVPEAVQNAGAVNAVQIQGQAVSATPPTGGQVLSFSALNNRWEPGAGSANATQFQGRNVAATAPVDGQVWKWNNGASQWEPGNAAGGGSTYNTRFSTDFNWTKSYDSGWGALTAGVPATLTLATCPVGVDVTGSPNLGGPQGAYSVLISGVGTTEAVKVTGGTCTSGGTNQTITFTPFFSHSVGYSLSSATAGIQEAINNGCGADAGASTYYKNGGCRIVITPSGPPTTINVAYDIYDTIYFHANESILEGYGVILNCRGRGPCLQVGDLLNANHYANNKIAGISFRAPVDLSADPAFNGSLISNTVRASGTATVTTNAAHGLRTGDMVCQMLTDDKAYWGEVPSITVTGSTTYTYTRSGGVADIPSQNTPGTVALAYYAILDNGNSNHFEDIQYTVSNALGKFTHFFSIWDDENCVIERFNNNAHTLVQSANWTGSFVFSGGANNLPNNAQQLAAVISIRNTNLTANGSNGVTVYNSNGLYIYDSVFQATGPYQVYVSNNTGNFQGAYLSNVYSETALSLNPASPAKSPWPGLGVGGMQVGLATGAASFNVVGNGSTAGIFPTSGSGSTTWVYYVIAKDVTAGTQTSPLPVQYFKGNGSETPTVQWPRIANGQNTITYDVIRTVAPVGTVQAASGNFVAPYNNGCPGGTNTTCGSVVTGQAQGAGFIQSFVDNTATATAAYNTIPRGTFAGVVHFLPVAVATMNTPVQVDNESFAAGIGMGGLPVMIAKYCSAFGENTSGGPTICIASKLSGNSIPNHTALFLQDGTTTGGGTTQSKGRLNFLRSKDASFNKHHIITLVDSDPAKTQATSGYRPLADANDTWIGVDNGSVGYTSASMALGAPVAISNYIANVGDGTAWLERLTSTKKQFAVPVQLASYTFATLPGSPVNGWMVYCSDCTVAGTCAGSGTGAMAKRINGAWVCN